MVQADETGHEGWKIQTNCTENKPDDWRPGDPIPYVACVTARMVRPREFGPGWKSTAAFRIPEQGNREFINDYKLAHDTLRNEAQRRIDALKN